MSENNNLLQGKKCKIQNKARKMSVDEKPRSAGRSKNISTNSVNHPEKLTPEH